MSSKLFRGTFILTLGTLISKVLGLFYIIPFYAIIDKYGTVLYSYSYIPYTIFISVATAGVPLAVSKFIAKYNALGEYYVGRKLFKSGIAVMLATGMLSFLVMYFTAPGLADLISTTSEQNVVISNDDIVTVIRAVSFALIVVPFMSLIRGFFQGHQSMGPSAVSQIIEQVVRIVFLLAGAYIVLKIMNGSMVTAVSVATFAAFVGAIGSLAVLGWYWYKRKPYLDELLLEDKGTMDVSLKEIYKEILIYAAPFIFVGIANPLFQFIDMLTFEKTMVSIGIEPDDAKAAFGTLNFQTHKIVIIPVSLATAFSLTLIPSITQAFIDKDRIGMRRQLDQTLQLLLYLTVPAAFGLSILSQPMFTVFFENDPLGAEVLKTYAPVAILFALYSVTAAVLQGINEQRFTILSLLTGLLVKLSLNIPMIKLFGTQGAVTSTALGYMTSIIINIFVIKKFIKYPMEFVTKRIILILLFSGLMGGVTIPFYNVLIHFLSPASKYQSIIIITLTSIVGAFVYFYIGIRTRLVERIFGEKVVRIKKKLKMH